MDIPFSVGLWEEGVGQDTPRAIKWQVVPMPVPAEGWGGAESAAADRWGCPQRGSRPPVYLVKSIMMSARPSCTSVKVSGVTSLHNFRASAIVRCTCSRTSCHGYRRILGGEGGAWASLRAGSAPDGYWARVAQWGVAGTQDTGQVSLRCGALMWVHTGVRIQWEEHQTRSPKTHLIDLTGPLTVGRT